MEINYFLFKNFLLLFIIFFNHTIVSSNVFNTNSKRQNDDHCFCKLKGSIDDCDCNVDTVDYFNNMRIYPRLQSLLIRPYFRFYKVNLKQECPFWNDDSKCAMQYCRVQPCDHTDIPEGLKGDYLRDIHFYENPADKYRPGAGGENSLSNCDRSSKDHNMELGYLNTTISSDHYKEFELWQQYDDAQDNFCVKASSPGEYVDLLLNPERYTGYKGSSAHRIWRSIYLENCFRPENSPHAFIPSSKIYGMCLEKRAFYRAISGLHASINIHLCSKFLLSEHDSLGALYGGQWGPNLQELQQRFGADTTGGEGPSWVKNLYFTYLLELRALAKAAPYLEREKYFTGNKADDDDTRLAMIDILHVIKSFKDHFNETIMFTGGTQAQVLKEEFRQHFRNISRIMDCVGCDKCKLWGKLQIHGLGTALKILFSGKFDYQTEPIFDNPRKTKFFLERSEIVALVNGFGRLSESIFELERFRQMMR